MNHPIVEMIERGLELDYEKQQEENPREPGLHVSHVNKCSRQTYFELTGTPISNPLTTDSLVNFKVGRAVEDAFTSMLAAAGATIIREAEVRIPVNGTKVVGHIDTLGIFVDDHFAVELKSTSSRSMRFTAKEGGKEDHKRQLHLYLHGINQGLLDEQFGQEVRLDHAYLTYLVKDATKGEQVVHPFNVPYDEHLANNDLFTLKLVEEMAQEGIDPGVPDEYGPNHWLCKSYCSYRTRCFGSQVRSD